MIRSQMVHRWIQSWEGHRRKCLWTCSMALRTTRKSPFELWEEDHAIGMGLNLTWIAGTKIEKSLTLKYPTNYQSKALSSDIIKYKKSKMGWDCLTKLRELGKHNNMALLWIPGHSGQMKNETVDELATQSSPQFIGPNVGSSLAQISTEKGRITYNMQHMAHPSPGMCLFRKASAPALAEMAFSIINAK